MILERLLKIAHFVAEHAAQQLLDKPPFRWTITVNSIPLKRNSDMGHVLLYVAAVDLTSLSIEMAQSLDLQNSLVIQ